MDDQTAELKGSRIKKDCSDLKKVNSQIQNSSAGASVKLFNISTGNVAAETTDSCLLEVLNIGKARHDEFCNDCLEELRMCDKEDIQKTSNPNERDPDKRIATLVF